MFLRILIASALVGLVWCNNFVRMERDVRVGKGWELLSEASPSTQLELTFAVKLNNAEVLHDKLMKVSSPKSADYGKILSYDEMRGMTDPKEESILHTIELLSQHGVEKFKIVGGFIKATVDVKIAEKILSTKYSTFKHSASGKVVVRCEEYSLPEKFAAHIDFVSPTVNFPRSFSVKVESAPAAVGQNTPDSLRELYNVGTVQGGKSSGRQAVTAFLDQYYTESDLQAFYAKYYPTLSGVPIANVVGPNDGRAGIEASLDVEYMTTLGSGVPTEFWSYAGSQPDNVQNEPFLDWLVDLGNTANPPWVFSTSYGEDEASVSLDYATRMNQEFQKNSLRGITFLFASGDSGVGSAFGPCTTYTPQYPSDSPYVTAVGATTGKNPETAAGLSSGGFSNRWARPSWQDDAVAAYLSSAPNLPDASLYNATGRGFRDVSAQGTLFVVINAGITVPAVAGTSASSPTFGGIVGLLVSSSCDVPFAY